MAAAFHFLAGEDFVVEELSGSGLGFFRDTGFGYAVMVGDWQGRTYITNGNGTTQGPEVDNVKYLNAGSGILGQSGSGIALTAIPNYQATLNVRFTYDTEVTVTNVRMGFFDRSSISNPPSGVTVKAAEIIHPGITQSNDGSGDTTWYTPYGTGVTVPLANSPGPSGLFAGNGSDSTYAATQHDWYVAISASPDSAGTKTMFALFVECEYL